MATILTPSYPQFVFVFAAVRRADRKPCICMLRTVAGDEHAARRSLVRDYVLSFAGRLPVAEVRASDTPPLPPVTSNALNICATSASSSMS